MKKGRPITPAGLSLCSDRSWLHISTPVLSTIGVFARALSRSWFISALFSSFRSAARSSRRLNLFVVEELAGRPFLLAISLVRACFNYTFLIFPLVSCFFHLLFLNSRLYTRVLSINFNCIHCE